MIETAPLARLAAEPADRPALHTHRMLVAEHGVLCERWSDRRCTGGPRCAGSLLSDKLVVRDLTENQVLELGNELTGEEANTEDPVADGCGSTNRAVDSQNPGTR